MHSECNFDSLIMKVASQSKTPYFAPYKQHYVIDLFIAAIQFISRNIFCETGK